jgi:copper chaperone CopZ
MGMFRRRFVHLVTFAGAEGLTAIASTDTGKSRAAIFRVKGFSCVTCAVGLDTMLRGQRGVLWSRANYVEGSVVITYDPKEVTEASLRGFIEGMGFSVEEMHTD